MLLMTHPYACAGQLTIHRWMQLIGALLSVGQIERTLITSVASLFFLYSFILIGFCFFVFVFFPVVHWVLLLLWLSNYHQNLLPHLPKQKTGKRADQKERGKSLITLDSSSVRSLINPSYLPMMSSQEPPQAISSSYLA